MGAALAAGRLTRASMRSLAALAGPVLRVAVDPPLIPHAWRPVRRLEAWGLDWRDRRAALVRAGVEATRDVAATTAEVVLPLVDLTPAANSVLERLDLASLVEQVIAELDIGAIVDQALDEVDVTAVVLERVDLGAVVEGALDDVDLTDVVLTRVALEAVVTAALDTLDLTSLVRERVDLADLAEQVVDEIDLPAIIQQSTGSVASEAVQSARLTSVDADEALSRFADRLLLRARRRRLDSGASLEGEDHGDAP